MTYNEPFISKYRPVKIEDYDIDGTTLRLIKQLQKMDELTIMIVGSGGNGKTSIINTLISEYYGNDNNENIMRINNLLEHGINFYRGELKTFCQTSSSIHGKKKIVVLDDIDYICEQGQQIFRNLIDKYKNKVHFLASCVNQYKVITSVQSRFIIIKKPPITYEMLFKMGKDIAQKESIKINDDVLKHIIVISNSNVHSIINYMEKFKLLDMDITMDITDMLCTNISIKDLDEYTQICKKTLPENIRDAVNFIIKLSNRGYSVIDILDSYSAYLKISTLLTDDHKYEIVKIICKYINIFNYIHEDNIELIHFTNGVVRILQSV